MNLQEFRVTSTDELSSCELSYEAVSPLGYCDWSRWIRRLARETPDSKPPSMYPVKPKLACSPAKCRWPIPPLKMWAYDKN